MNLQDFWVHWPVKMQENPERMEFKANSEDLDYNRFDICPSCGETVVVNGRCRTCYSCGWSSCDL